MSVSVPALLLFAFTRDAPQPIRGAGGLAVGSVAPDFVLTSRSGERVRLRDLRPTPVVLAFWASWCTPCRKELPLVQDALDDRRGEFEVLAVNWDDHVEGDVTRFLSELAVELPTFPDPDDLVGDAYGVRGIPLTFFIDDRGVIRDRVYGITSRGVLDEALATVLDPR